MADGENRRLLLNMMRGYAEHYTIDFCVDARGILTIMGGDVRRDCMAHVGNDLHAMHTEDDLGYYLHGREIMNMENAAAAKYTEDDIVAAFLDFRQQHPRDGYGLWHDIAKRWCNAPEDGLRGRRDDEAAVREELKRRNRAYIKEMYGEDLPLDFDFRSDYYKRAAAR